MANDVFEIVGTTLERKYRIDKAIGEGGFGVVYRGHHLGFDAPIAVKCLKMPAHFTAEARTIFYTRFREEGKLLLRLSGEHLSIVRVFDFGVVATASQPFPYLVLEWLDGCDLQEHLRLRAAAGEPLLGEIAALKLLRPAMEALAVAHRAGVAHRDVKPENFFIARGEAGSVLKVLDFGIAKVMQEGESATQVAGTNTSSGFRAFSPNHGAPEQFSAKRYGATGPWTDVHALGLILVEMVTGKRAVEGEEMVDVIESALAETRPTPRARGAQVSDAFEALCARALACMPRDRFKSGDEMLAAVDAILAAAGEAATTSGSARVGTEVRVPPSSYGAPADMGPTIPDHPPGMTEPASGPGQSPGVIGSAPLVPPPAARLSPAKASRVPLAIGGVVGLGFAGWLAVKATSEPAKRHDTTSEIHGAAPPAPSTELAVTHGAAAPPASRTRAMIAIPAGTFSMGSTDGAADEKPVHSVTVAAFEIDETETTVADYRACVSASACREPDAGVDCNWGKRDRDAHPVNCVSWQDATAYCTFAKKRLPTEEEWELAARGDGRKYPWGGAQPTLGGGPPELCWGRHVGEGTCAVGSFPTSKTPLGVEDLAGNVSEWTSSRFCPYSSKQCSEDRRVVRGGAWLSAIATAVTTTRRQKEDASSRTSVIGFRCARGGT